MRRRRRKSGVGRRNEVVRRRNEIVRRRKRKRVALVEGYLSCSSPRAVGLFAFLFFLAVGLFAFLFFRAVGLLGFPFLVSFHLLRCSCLSLPTCVRGRLRRLRA